MKKYLLLLSALVLLAPGQELILNGDFENGINSWTVEVDNEQGAYDISVCTTYCPDPGYAVRVYKYMRWRARLSQAASLSGLDYRFSASLKLLASKGSTSGYEADAALIFEYLNHEGNSLGRTMIVKHVGDGYPGNSPRQHVYLVTSDDWEDYEFVVADEIRNHLTGINPAWVGGVRVILEAYGNGSAG